MKKKKLVITIFIVLIIVIIAIVVAICMVAMVGGLGNHAYIGLVFAILVWIAIGFYWMFKKEYEDERRKK